MRALSQRICLTRCLTPCLTLCLALFLALPLTSVAEVELLNFDSPQHEQRYKKLIAELRCLVCQNQNLADSNAELAQDLRKITYNMISEGSNDNEIIDFMVARYGDFVLYRPPFKTSTLLLWVGPFIILAIGVLSALFVIRRRKRQTAQAVDDTQLKQAQALLRD
ncbi:MAG: cytochrome c-type biogenesis protein CcmH [Gammaproteobacteria bacterium]|nr:cytochrome c-type biogenesis protein CcmH [Gammaproteobacteria bacterium]